MKILPIFYDFFKNSIYFYNTIVYNLNINNNGGKYARR